LQPRSDRRLFYHHKHAVRRILSFYALLREITINSPLNKGESAPRIAFVVNHAAFFVSHRLALATGAKAFGYEVALFTGQPGSLLMEESAEQRLAEERITHTRSLFRSSGINPFFELFGLIQLIQNIYKFNPTIIHCASPKAVLYGGIAARILNIPGLVLAISGMGYAFTSTGDNKFRRIFIKKIYEVIINFIFRHPNIIVITQNKDDYREISSKKMMNQSSVELIRGSGVDLSLFVSADATKKEKLVLLPARMLRDKGVKEFVDAVRIIRSEATEWRFVLAGAASYDNPTAISNSELEHWASTAGVEWVGHIEDMTSLFTDAAIVCLPSYREGMPKVLLEAAAAGCAIVTTDVTGCREAIEPGVTGDLVPARDHHALASALRSLILDDNKREQYGINGQQRATALFSINAVVGHTINIYDALNRAGHLH
jgi:glycosyltransferase involved in cell wall biosynthesis